MAQLSIHSQDYAELYLDSHKNSAGQSYRMDYWNHFFLDSIINVGKQNPTHLLEEGGGTCGIWDLLSFDRYTSIDISEPMTEAASKLHAGTPERQFVQGDIFSEALIPSAYAGIVANAYGLYYRPNLGHLRRFHDLLSKDGLLFVAIDPVVKMKHMIAAPVASLIDRHVRPYSRVSSGSFEKMVARAGFKIWQTIDYTPAANWKRRAYILQK